MQPESSYYQVLQAGFKRWLGLLNHSPVSVSKMPPLLGEFLSYLERENIMEPSRLTESHLQAYHHYLEHRPNRQKEGGLSLGSIRQHWRVIRKFSHYLPLVGKGSFTVNIRLKAQPLQTKIILNKAEVKKLYEVTTEDIYGLRDRVLLALYYSCGLRNSEGLNMEVKDVLMEKELLYVRYGKGYKERYVPLTAQSKQALEHYLTYSRPYLQGALEEKKLLLNVQGTRLSATTIFERLQRLKQEAGIAKQVGAHTLRHSIATHLLQSGMELEQIRRFLGHSSLESTQIYTHIVHESAGETGDL